MSRNKVLRMSGLKHLSKSNQPFTYWRCFVNPIIHRCFLHFGRPHIISWFVLLFLSGRYLFWGCQRFYQMVLIFISLKDSSFLTPLSSHPSSYNYYYGREGALFSLPLLTRASVLWDQDSALIISCKLNHRFNGLSLTSHVRG